MGCLRARVTRAAIGAATVAAFAIGCLACSNTTSGATGPNRSATCSSDPPQGGPPPAGQPDIITIVGAQPPSCQVSCPSGGGIPLFAIVKDVNGTILDNQTVTWSSSDPAVVTAVGKGLGAQGYVGALSCFVSGTAQVSAVVAALQATVTVQSE